MSANGISTLSTKEERQVAKLNLAALKRQGYTLNTDGTVASGPDTSKAFYRDRNEYDITELPDTYDGNLPGADNNPNTGGLVYGRPWDVPVIVEAGAILMETGDDLLQENGNQLFTEAT